MADDDLAGVSLDLNHIKRRTRCHSKALSLAHREVVDAAMLANDRAISRDQFAGGIGQRFTLLGKISVEEFLVVATGNEADLLGVGLLSQSQPVLAGQFAHLRLHHSAQRKERAAELVLGQAEQKISLVLGPVRRALEQPASEHRSNSTLA